MKEGAYVMLARFPKGHVMERHPGPLMVIPERDWDNFLAAFRPALNGLGMVTNTRGFIEEMAKHFPEIAEKIAEWGNSVQIQIWREPAALYARVDPEKMRHAS